MTDMPSRDTLEDTPDRAARFLRAASQNPEILATLGARGYSAPVHAEGWQLYLAACNAPAAATPPSEPSPIAQRAIATLSREDASLIAIIQAALRAQYGEQASFITAGLKDADGSGAVANVATMLARMGELASGDARVATRDADHAALAALDAVRIDAAERQRLATLVADAQSWDAIAVAAVPLSAAARFEARVPKLMALYGWYRMWADIAAALITRRDWLVSLGLAKRKKKEKAPDPV